MNREDFGPIVLYLAAAVNKPVPREQAEVFYDLLKDFPAFAVQAAARQALLESQYPTLPPVGVLHRLAREAVRRQREQTERRLRHEEHERAQGRAACQPITARALIREYLSRGGKGIGYGSAD